MENLRKFSSPIDETKTNKYIAELDVIFSIINKKVLLIINEDDVQIIDLANLVIRPTNTLGKLADGPSIVKVMSFLDPKSMKDLCLIRNCQKDYSCTSFDSPKDTDTDLLGVE